MVAVIFKIVGKNYGTYCGSFLHGTVCIVRKVRMCTSLEARKGQPVFKFTFTYASAMLVPQKVTKIIRIARLVIS
jgi:hypothetical protein